jgi:RNA polymerase sigma-70 factor (ECF subfamily)
MDRIRAAQIPGPELGLLSCSILMTPGDSTDGISPRAADDDPAKQRSSAFRRPGKVEAVFATKRGDGGRELGWEELASLVVSSQEGDREAFGRLIEQFQPTVYAIALRRLGDLTEALELTQDVFLHVLQTIGQLREPERFAGWIRQVAVRMAINRATRRWFPATVENELLEGARRPEIQPLDRIIDEERAERVKDALERLKRRDRESLVAFYIKGMSLMEIGTQFQIPVGTVKQRLHTARHRLRLELESLADNDPSDPIDWQNSGDPGRPWAELEVGAKKP